jgi:hypothetical protein
MTTTFKHLDSHISPPSTNISSGHSTTPTMQAIVVNCVAIVQPQLAAIIGDKLEVVTAGLKDSQAASPTHSEMVISGEARPAPTSVAVVDHVSPTSHVWSTTIKILASPTLTKIEDILPEKASAVGRAIGDVSSTTGTCNNPSVASVRAMVPE